MATADEYAAWIVQNRAKRGTRDFETVVQAYEQAKQKEGRAQAPGAPQAAQPQQFVAPPAVRPAETGPEPTIGERIVGAGETALSLLTGAVGAPLGMIQGTGAGVARAILSGQFGTPQAAAEIERAATEQAGRFTYAPRTRAGAQSADGYSHPRCRRGDRR
jgi:hypothetical protein